MAISYVGHAGADAAVVALPAFTAGDMAVVFAFRNGSGTAASIPSGWTNIASDVNVNVSYRVGYKILTASDTTTDTWTNAVDIQVDVYRGATGIGGLGVSTKGNSTVLSIPAVTLTVTTGASWVYGGYGHDVATTSYTRTQDGMTTRSGSHSCTNLFSADAANVTSWASPASTTVNGSGRWIGYAIEILAGPLYLPSIEFIIDFDLAEPVIGKVLQGAWLPPEAPPPTTWTPPASPSTATWTGESPSSGTWDATAPSGGIPFLPRYPPSSGTWDVDTGPTGDTWVLPPDVSLGIPYNMEDNWIPYATVTDLASGIDFVPKASAVAPYHASIDRPAVIYNTSTITASGFTAERRP